MPEQQPPAAPVLITDKRQQKREEAETKRLEQEIVKRMHDEELPPGAESTDEAMARVDRIQALREKWQAGSLDADEQAELLQLQGEQAEAENGAGDGTIDARTAFLVIIGHDGSARATSDVNTLLTIEHEANVDEMFTGACIIKRDIEASIASKHVVFGLNVSAQAMQEKAMAIQQANMMQGRSPRRR